MRSKIKINVENVIVIHSGETFYICIMHFLHRKLISVACHLVARMPHVAHPWYRGKYNQCPPTACGVTNWP